MKRLSISGNIVDLHAASIFPGTVDIEKGRIIRITRNGHNYDTFITPGFIDAHIHIESSMLPPSEFSRIAAVHGTVATVSDPHEIANVLGLEGVRYMIEDAKTVPFQFFFGAPSCVPATPLESSGAVLGPAETETLLNMEEILYLSEMMNVPGVLNSDPEVMQKIAAAHRRGKPVDGHAPGLRDEALEQYIRAGIATDHETSSLEEGEEKIRLGMKLLVREGSAARDLDSLLPLVAKYSEACMFCSDDRHPDDLLKGHINDLVKRAVAFGIPALTALRVASLNPVVHYGLDLGLLREGDRADFIVVDNLKDFSVLQTWIGGELVAEKGRPLIPRHELREINNFGCTKKSPADFAIPAKGEKAAVIEVTDGRLDTGSVVLPVKVKDGFVVSDTDQDILTIAVMNRYKDTPVALGLVRNIGLRKGAIAASVAHDSHNIVAVGVTNEALCRAVNLIIENKGGIALVAGDEEHILPLPIAGLMATGAYTEVAAQYARLNTLARNLGSPLSAPFMTLSFLSLIVIPKLKLSDRGLFDVESFEHRELFEG